MHIPQPPTVYVEPKPLKQCAACGYAVNVPDALGYSHDPTQSTCPRCRVPAVRVVQPAGR